MSLQYLKDRLKKRFGIRPVVQSLIDLMNDAMSHSGNTDLRVRDVSRRLDAVQQELSMSAIQNVFDRMTDDITSQMLIDAWEWIDQHEVQSRETLAFKQRTEAELGKMEDEINQLRAANLELDKRLKELE